MKNLVEMKYTIRKVNFDKTLQFFSGNQSCQQLKSANPVHFHELFTQNSLTIFLVKSKLSTAKKPKNRHFHEFFTQIFLTIFLVKSKFHDFFQDFFSREKSR